MVGGRRSEKSRDDEDHWTKRGEWEFLTLTEMGPFLP